MSVASTWRHIKLTFDRTGESADEMSKEYALKLIEGSGISMSACREIAVSFLVLHYFYGIMSLTAIHYNCRYTRARCSF